MSLGLVWTFWEDPASLISYNIITQKTNGQKTKTNHTMEPKGLRNNPQMASNIDSKTIFFLCALHMVVQRPISTRPIDFNRLSHSAVFNELQVVDFNELKLNMPILLTTQGRPLDEFDNLLRSTGRVGLSITMWRVRGIRNQCLAQTTTIQSHVGFGQNSDTLFACLWPVGWLGLPRAAPRKIPMCPILF